MLCSGAIPHGNFVPTRRAEEPRNGVVAGWVLLNGDNCCRCEKDHLEEELE
jgi:hypothetical protein